MSKWRHRKLGDLLEITHGYAFKGEFFSDRGDFVLLTPGNFREDGGLKLKGDKEKYYRGDFPQEFMLHRGDLLVAMTDLTQNAPILGSPATIPQDGRFLHNQRLGKIINIRTEQVTPEFLFYLFNTIAVRGQIKGSASGATVRHTSPTRIYEVSVELPSLPVQRRIVSVLSAYDQLIENCERRIDILDEMVRIIFHEWLVPSRYRGNGRGSGRSRELPVGWRIAKLGAVAESIRRNVPKGVFEDARIYVGLEHIPRRSLALNDWITTTMVESNKLEFETGEVLFGKMKWTHLSRQILRSRSLRSSC